MNIDEKLINKALKLKPQDKLVLIEALVESLDKSGKYIQEVWIKEAQERLKAHREGKTN
jgi:putative addiction module component (TIGR02574 family)